MFECPFCGLETEDAVPHLRRAHNKTADDLIDTEFEQLTKDLEDNRLLNTLFKGRPRTPFGPQ